MLLNLHVKNLAIIDEVEVDFAKHLNVLTGETGAGKSIIIGSINIALGGKIAKDMIRKEAEFALVELTFLIEDKKVRADLEEMGVSFEDDTLLISRKIARTRTMNRVNGESVTGAMIKRIADLLIDIHGQNDQQSLLHKEKHLEIVDRYAKEQMAGKEILLAKTYKAYKNLKEELQINQVPEEERLREISFLQYELEEIENARLLPGEEEELALKYRKLSNATDIAQGLSGIYSMMSQESGSVSDKVSEGIRILSKISEYDERVSDFWNQLSDIDSLITDFSRDVSDYMEEFDVGLEELEEVEKRLDLVRSIKAKYGTTTEAVLAYAEQIREKLMKYQEYETYQESLKKKIEKEEKKVQNLSKEISTIRKKCAKVLEKEITQALVDLNFISVEFRIEIKQKEHLTDEGTDYVEFMISTNPGEPLKPLAKVASGGELSRIMLAIKSILATEDEIETLIFDEIDTGISGKTASMVAEKLARISKNHQVLCISHLAQIAAMADNHYLIQKKSENDVTTTNIYQLGRNESIEELVRINGDGTITSAAISHAMEMKDMADRTKSNLV